MSTYRRYQDARDAAWRTLLRFSARALPVDVRGIAAALGLSLHPFPDAQEEPRLHALVSRAMGSANCVSLRLGRAWHCFLSPGITEESHIRFALAHELGHLILAHETYAVSPGVRAFQGRENAADLIEDPRGLDDYAADIFAIRLLAPACVLQALGADTPARIGALCGLPPRASALRAERMTLLETRNAFFSHPLERQVYDRFRPYLSGGTAAPLQGRATDASSRPALDASLPRSAAEKGRKSPAAERIAQGGETPEAEKKREQAEGLSPAGEKISAFLDAASAAATERESGSPETGKTKWLIAALALLLALGAAAWALGMLPGR